jgi:hypothetical protein
MDRIALSKTLAAGKVLVTSPRTDLSLVGWLLAQIGLMKPEDTCREFSGALPSRMNELSRGAHQTPDTQVRPLKINYLYDDGLV